MSASSFPSPISPNALQRALAENDKLRRALQPSSFDTMDRNMDGVIDRREFNDYLAHGIQEHPVANPPPSIPHRLSGAAEPMAYNSFFARLTERPDHRAAGLNHLASAPLFHASTSTAEGMPPQLPMGLMPVEHPPAAIRSESPISWRPPHRLAHGGPPAHSGPPGLPPSLRPPPQKLAVIEAALEQNEQLRSRLRAAREETAAARSRPGTPSRRGGLSKVTDPINADMAEVMQAGQVRSRLQGLISEDTQKDIRAALAGSRSNSPLPADSVDALITSSEGRRSGPVEVEELKRQLRQRDATIAQMKGEIAEGDKKINEIIDASEAIVKSALGDQQNEIEGLKSQLDRANKVIESERGHLNFALEKLGMRRLELLESISSSQNGSPSLPRHYL